MLLALASCACPAATTCRFTAGGVLAFPSYDLLSASPTDTLTTISITCARSGGPQTVSVSLALGPGQSGTSATARRLARTGGGDFLSYGLFRDANRASPWGYTSGVDTMSMVVSMPNNGSSSANFTIYGRIPASQNVSSGSYGDSVQMTLSP